MFDQYSTRGLRPPRGRTSSVPSRHLATPTRMSWWQKVWENRGRRRVPTPSRTSNTPPSVSWRGRRGNGTNQLNPNRRVGIGRNTAPLTAVKSYRNNYNPTRSGVNCASRVRTAAVVSGIPCICGERIAMMDFTVQRSPLSAGLLLCSVRSFLHHVPDSSGEIGCSPWF